MMTTPKRFGRWWKRYGKELARVFIPEYLARRAFMAGYRAGKAHRTRLFAQWDKEGGL